MNKKGFTLIELIAVVTIIGVVSIMMFPSLNKVLSDNTRSACQNYEKAMVAAAKLYMQKEGWDILEAHGNGNYTINVTFSQLKSYGYIENYSDQIDEAASKTDVVNPYVTVTYTVSTKTYTFTPHMTCRKKSSTNEVIYSK